jgi:S-adenosylmethionine synthetase
LVDTYGDTPGTAAAASAAKTHEGGPAGRYISRYAAKHVVAAGLRRSLKSSWLTVSALRAGFA